MPNVKTIALTGKETEIDFEQNFMCFWVQNLGNSTIYASNVSSIVPESDGVISIPAGSSARISASDLTQISRIYLSGTGKVQIIGTYSVHCPFKTAGKGGGGTGGTDNYNDLMNIPTFEGIPWTGNLTWEDLGVNFISDEQVDEMLDKAFGDSGTGGLEDEAIYKLHYDEPLQVSNLQLDTTFSQSVFSEGFTVVYKVNYAQWSNYRGLLGLHNSEIGEPKGLALQMSDNSWNFKTPHRMGWTVNYDGHGDIDKDIVLIMSDGSEKTFIMINGSVIEIEIGVEFTDWNPYGKVYLFKSYPTDDRFFYGTAYDVLIFDRPLSEYEAAKITDRLMEEG